MAETRGMRDAGAEAPRTVLSSRRWRRDHGAWKDEQMSNSAPPPEPNEDVLFVHSPVEKGEGYRVIRKHKQSIEVGEIRNLKEGRPLQGEPCG